MQILIFRAEVKIQKIILAYDFRFAKVGGTQLTQAINASNNPNFRSLSSCSLYYVFFFFFRSQAKTNYNRKTHNQDPNILTTIYKESR